jgi:hypothetical protein
MADREQLHAPYTGLVTRLRGPTAGIAAFRELDSQLRPPTSGLQTIAAGRKQSAVNANGPLPSSWISRKPIALRPLARS